MSNKKNNELRSAVDMVDKITNKVLDFVLMVWLLAIGFLQKSLDRLFLIKPRLGTVLFLIAGVAIILLGVYNDIVRGNFHGDAFAQQVFVESWIRGDAISFARTGTNYAIKMPFYALMFFTGLPPLVRHVITICIFNVLGWVLIYVFTLKNIKLICGEISDTAQKLVRFFMLFSATLFGVMFWNIYPNSRQIEVGLALAVIYMFIKVFSEKQRTSWLKIFLGCFFTGLLLFSDSYVAMVVLGGFGLFALMKAIVLLATNRRKIEDWRPLGRLAITMLASFVFYRAISYIMIRLTPFSPGNSGTGLTFVEAREFFVRIADSIPAIMTQFGLDVNAISTDEYSRTLFIFASLFWLTMCAVIVKSIVEIRKEKTKVLTSDQVAVIATLALVALLAPLFSEMVVPRYYILLPFLALILMASAVSKKATPIMKYVLVPVIAAVLIFSSTRAITATGYLRSEGWPVNEATQVVYDIVEVAQRNDLRKGYASLLLAQPATFMSEGFTQVNSLWCYNQDSESVRFVYSYSLIDKGAIYNLQVDRSFLVMNPEDDLTVARGCSHDLMLEQIGAPVESIELHRGFVLHVFDFDITESISRRSQ